MGEIMVTFREGRYPFNFTISRKGIYVLLRIGDHNFRLSTFGRFRLTHEVMPYPWYRLLNIRTGEEISDQPYN